MKNSRNLQSLIYSSYLTSSLVPILMIELVLLLLYFGINSYISQQNKQTMLSEVSQHLQEVTWREANNINNQLKEVSRYALMLQREHVKFFSSLNSCFLPNGEPDFGFHPNGVYYKRNNNGGSSLYYSSSTSVGRRQKKKARCSEKLDELFISIVQTSPVVNQAYLNTWDGMSRIYPFLKNAPEQFGPVLNMEEYNFYYEADRTHNPERKPVWTGVYLDPAGQGWMISNVVPIYNGDFLEGVSGLDVTIDTFLRQILDFKISWAAKAFMVDENGSILAVPESLRDLLGLKSLDYRRSPEITDEILSKRDDYNLLKNESLAISPEIKRIFSSKTRIADIRLDGRPYLLSQEIVPETGWRLMTLVDKSNIFAKIYELDRMSYKIGVLAILAMLFFNAAFFLYLHRKSIRLATRIASPIEKLSDLTSDLGGHLENSSLDITGIRELDDLNTNFNEMTRELTKRTKELVEFEIRERIKKKEAEMFEALAQTDHLTGLANRHRLDEILEGEFARTNRNNNPFGVILMDMDHFKLVNDTYGHQVGDQLLIETAELLRSNIRKTDTAGRWGGEEFLIICPDAHREGLEEMAEHLRQAVEAFDYPVAGKKTASFGLALSQPGDKIRLIIGRADRALYKAKSEGRNRVRFV